MDWEIAEFLGFSGYQVSQQKAQLIKEKEGTNLLNTQDSNATSKPAACDYMETVCASGPDLQEEPLDDAEDSWIHRWKPFCDTRKL